MNGRLEDGAGDTHVDNYMEEYECPECGEILEDCSCDDEED